MFSLPSYKRSYLWVAIILCLKLLFLVFYYSCFYPLGAGQTDGLVFINKDFAEFYYPIDTLIKTGTYSFEGNEPFAGRMPGYFFPATLFRFLFARSLTLHLTVLTQLILSAVAVYFLASVLSEITKKKFVFPFVVICFCFFSYYVNFDTSFHPGSFSVSAYILSLCFFYRFLDAKKAKYLFLSGLFVAWAVFLRPFLGIYLLTFAITLVAFSLREKRSIKYLTINSFVFFSSFILLEGVWVARNYFSLGRIIPLQTSFAPGEKSGEYGFSRNDKYSIQKLRDLIFAWGGDNLWYVNGTEMSWFVNRRQDRPVFKDYVYCKSYNEDSLVELKKNITESFSSSLTAGQHDSLESLIEEKSTRFAKGFIAEKKMRYYFVSPFLRLKNFLFMNVVMDWPGPSFKNSGMPYKLLKLSCLAVYWFSLCGALLLFPFSGFLKHGKEIILLCVLNLFGLLFVFGFLINFAHHTYFFTGFISSFFLSAAGFCLLKKQSPGLKLPGTESL